MSVAYAFTDEQISDIEETRAVFNNFTGSRLTLQQYIHFFINDAIKAEKIAAQNANALVGTRPRKSSVQVLKMGVQNVH